jgi:type II secretory pathway pseudopilin PulG
MNGMPEWRRTGRASTRQCGVVLVTALLLLLVLTVLAVAGLVTATLELRMAGNVQQQERAFAAAEHAIERALLAADLNTSSSPVAPVKPECRDACTTPATEDPFDYSLYYDASAAGTPAPDGGHSLGAGLQAHHFIVEATGGSGPGARSEHTQGFYILGPAEP